MFSPYHGQIPSTPYTFLAFSSHIKIIRTSLVKGHPQIASLNLTLNSETGHLPLWDSHCTRHMHFSKRTNFLFLSTLIQRLQIICCLRYESLCLTDEFQSPQPLTKADSSPWQNLQGLAGWLFVFCWGFCFGVKFEQLFN